MLPNLQRHKWRLLGLFACACLIFAAFAYMIRDMEPPPIAQSTSVAPSPAQAPEARTSNAQTVLELFSPSDLDLSQQLSETALSQQVEQILTSSFVLTKCGLITDDDYADTFRALIVYAQRAGLAPDGASAEAKVRQVAESASASYGLVYSRTPCNNEKLPDLARRLLAWQETYLSR